MIWSIITKIKEADTGGLMRHTSYYYVNEKTLREEHFDKITVLNVAIGGERTNYYLSFNLSIT